MVSTKPKRSGYQAWVELDDTTATRLKEASKREDRSLASVIRRALGRYLDASEKEEA